MNFGYTQVLFMGSVPRINYLLATVSWYNTKISIYYFIIYFYHIINKVKVFHVYISITLYSKTCCIISSN